MSNDGNPEKPRGLSYRDWTPTYQPEKSARPGSPNIVIVILDDVGFSDFGCYGSEIETPNIDRLAGAGLRYNNFRTTSICSSTRASILTGLNHHSAGLGFLADFDGGYPGYRGDLTQEAPTVAEAMRDAGYSTLMVGKWHVNSSRTLSQNGPMHNWPAQRGFERSYWFNLHSNDYFCPYEMYEGNSMIQVGGDGYYITDDLTDRAIDYIRNQKAVSPEKPFFLYVAYNAAHSPLQARAEDRDKYLGRYDIGWDELRLRRLEKQKALGVVPEATQLPPRNQGIRAWADLTEQEKVVYARYMEVYAGVIDRVDQNVGRLADTLSALGQLDNTLFMVLSDNGASAEGTPEGTPNLMLTAYAQSVSIDEAESLYEVMGGPETFPHYPRGWAMASNTPFRMYKQYTYLGGICDPLVVHWPKGIVDPGGVRNQYVHVSDFFPTVLAAADLDQPTDYHGKPPKPIEGCSFAHTFADPAVASRHKEQYFEIGGQRAMYADGWHIVTWHKRGKPFEEDVWELYRPEEDFNEARNLAADYPEKVKELENRWIAAAHRYNVLPLDDRNFWVKIIQSRRRTAQRAHWEFTPPIQPLASHAAPLTGGRTHSITAQIDRPTDQAEGVLVAYGSRYYGYVLYVLGGYLVYEIALAPRSHVFRSRERLPVGRATVRFEMRMVTRPQCGVGHMFVNDVEIGEHRFEEVMIGVPYDGLDVGADLNVPVSTNYSAPFPFSGVLSRVVFDVDTSPPTRDEIEGNSRLIQMMS